MSNPLNCSIKHPSASATMTSSDIHQDTDIFSDDSGVDVKTQRVDVSQTRYAASVVESRRNKRKSSEPKKRKHVLQMKRFRWDTDEEELDKDDNEDVFEAIERERPSSGDSGCQIDAHPVPLVQPVVAVQVEKKKKQRQWRKPKVDKNSTNSNEVQVEDSSLPAFRQSVIRKHEACSSTSAPVPNLQLPSIPKTAASTAGSSLAGPGSVQQSAPDYDLILESQDDSNEAFSRTSSAKSVGRPRNYKSMSRQRRIEANARERTRVHTISAAFENLRRAVPAYAHNQKLSKLAILRIASAYIVALACLNQQDYSQEQSQPSLADCVEQCTRTIQAEGKSRRRSSKD